MVFPSVPLRFSSFFRDSRLFLLFLLYFISFFGCPSRTGADADDGDMVFPSPSRRLRPAPRCPTGRGATDSVHARHCRRWHPRHDCGVVVFPVRFVFLSSLFVCLLLFYSFLFPPFFSYSGEDVRAAYAPFIFLSASRPNPCLLHNRLADRYHQQFSNAPSI